MTRPGPRARVASAQIARKSLGQHFLIDKNIVHKIVRLAELQPGETVLEIGPGRGILTEALLDSSGLVVAVELDAALCARLRTTLGGRSNFRLIEGDALAFEYAQVPSPFLVVANLPYYVSTPLLFRLLEERQRIDRLVLMLQEEVVARLAAAPGGKDYGALSIAAQFYCEVRRAFRVSPTCFRPKPRVGSAVVVLTPLAKPRVSVTDEAFFFRVVRAGFAHRRVVGLRHDRRVGRRVGHVAHDADVEKRSVVEQPANDAETWLVEGLGDPHSRVRRSR